MHFNLVKPSQRLLDHHVSMRREPKEQNQGKWDCEGSPASGRPKFTAPGQDPHMITLSMLIDLKPTVAALDVDYEMIFCATCKAN